MNITTTLRYVNIHHDRAIQKRSNDLHGSYPYLSQSDNAGIEGPAGLAELKITSRFGVVRPYENPRKGPKNPSSKAYCSIFDLRWFAIVDRC